MIHHGCSKVFRGAAVSWLITGYYQAFLRMSDIKSWWLTHNQQKAKQTTNQIPSDKIKEVVGGPLNSHQLQFINELDCLDCSPWTLHVHMFPQLLLMEVSNHEHSQLRDNNIGLAGKGSLVVQCPAGPENKWSRRTLLANRPWLECQRQPVETTEDSGVSGAGSQEGWHDIPHI